MKVLFSGGCLNGKYIILPDDSHTWVVATFSDEILFEITDDICKPTVIDNHKYHITDAIDVKTGATIFEYMGIR